MIDSCQAHLSVQYASNIELIWQKWHWCCDWQRAIRPTSKTGLLLAPSTGCVYDGCSSFLFFTQTSPLIQCPIKYKTFCFLIHKYIYFISNMYNEIRKWAINSIFALFMASWILRVACEVNVKPEHETLQASLTLQETQSIHDSMNIPRIEFIS